MENIMKLFISFLLLILSVSTANAGSKKHILYVSQPDAMGCHNINNPQTCFKVALGLVILATKEQAEKKVWEKHEWFEVKKGATIKTPWWVKSNNLIAYNDFIKVLNSWKIKSFRYDSGDSRIELYFNRNGYVKYGGNKKLTGNVYIDPNSPPRLVQVRYMNPKYGELAYTYGYKAESEEIDIKTACVPHELCEQIKFK